MAGQSRTLKLSILADVDQLNKSLKAANSDVESSSNKMLDFGKKAGVAFAAAAAAAGAYAIKIGVDGVKAALEDEKAQRILALTLENTTSATKQQIKSVEDYITKTALATGVTDDQLRPALSRLVRSTKDTEEAQKLLGLAMDISSATGKPLEAISNSLGKAYDGNTNALGKLGLGIDQSILKTKDFNLVYENLRGSFAGFAEQEANTFQGRLDRLNVAFDESKETIGFALLPILEKMITFINDNALPIINAFSNAFSNKDGGLGGYITQVGNVITTVFTPIINGLIKGFGYVKDAIGENIGEFTKFGKLIADYVAPVIGTVLGAALQAVGKIAGGVINIVGSIAGVITTIVTSAIKAINWLIEKYNSIPLLPNIPLIPVAGAPSINMPSTPSTQIPNIPSLPPAPKPPSTGGSSGGSSGGGGGGRGSTSVEAKSLGGAAGAINAGFVSDSQNAARLAAQASAINSGFVSDSQNAARLAAQAPVINLTVNGAIDSEGTARTIIDTLNNSFFRGTGGATNLQTA